MILQEKIIPVDYFIPGVMDRENENMKNLSAVNTYEENIYNNKFNIKLNRTFINFLLYTIWCYVLVIDNCHGLPLNYDHNSGQQLMLLNNNNNNIYGRVRRSPLIYSDNLMNYLQNYGYLPETDRETGNLRSEDQLIEAIKNMQAFANIEPTGRLDAETKELLRRPRCGLPDIQIQRAKRKKRYTIHGQKWHYTNLTWSLQTQQLTTLDHGRVRRELFKALDIWAQNSQLTFQEVNSGNADIVINFHRGYHGDGYPFDGRGLILAHAFFPGPGRGGDAHFDEDEVWQLEGDSNDVGGTSLFAVAAHEFGHSLGLSHSSVSGALMYPWYQGFKENFELPDDDRHGIQQLYGAKGKLWAKIPTYIPDKNNDGSKTPWRPRQPPTTPRYRPTTTTVAPTTPHPRGDKPDTCDTSYDAISVIRSEVFIFKGKYMWRIGNKGLVAGYPVLIHRMWYKLPSNITQIDAVYERLDKKIVFFVGRQFYLFHGTDLERGYPRPLTYLGLPEALDRVDAAMVWGHNSKTYFFSGTMYWRYDEEVQKVELDYPRDMSIWRGVGYYIDAVFQWKDGATYFFKGKGFWRFNDLRMRVENERQSLSAPFWMGCPGKDIEKPRKEKAERTNFDADGEDRPSDDNNDNDVNDDEDDEDGSGSKLRLSIFVYVIPLFVLIYNIYCNKVLLH